MRTVKVSRNTRGLTLLELVFVVAILAILAGFLVPRFGSLRNLAGYAGNADQAKNALEQAFLYNIVVGHYPAGLDTLLGTSSATAALYNDDPVNNKKAKLSKELEQILEVWDIGGDTAGLKSLNSQLSADGTGNTGVVLNYHKSNAAAAGDSGTISATTPPASAPAAFNIARVKFPTAITDPSYAVYAGVYGTGKISSIGVPLDGSYLAAFGFGLNSEFNGRTSIGAPALFVRDPNDYNRAIELLKIWGNNTGARAGDAAGTSGALSPDGRLVSQSLTKYTAEKNR